MNRATRIAIITFMLVTLASAAVARELYWGIGTGLTRKNAEGDQGLVMDPFGGVVASIDHTPEDFSDVMESGFGFGGYVTDGKWLVKYKLGQIKLGSDVATTTAAGEAAVGDFFFDTTIAEVTLGYTVWRSDNRKMSLQPFAGLRYLKQDLGVDVTVSATPDTDVTAASDNNWTDIVIGTAFSAILAPKWSWNLSVDAGFGGSEGGYSLLTSLSWKVMKHLSLNPSFSFAAIDVRNGVLGDPDFYLYDANEFGFGLSFMLTF